MDALSTGGDNMRFGIRMTAAALSAVTGLWALPAAPAVAAATTAFDSDPTTTQRIGSDDPLATALDISRLRFDDGAAARVVLARSEAFADALAGAPLTDDGPLLLTPSAALDDAVAAELRRVLAPGGPVYLLGGPGALSPAIEQSIRSQGYEPKRLAGRSRVETAVAAAMEVHRLHPDQTEVALARSDDWADSVTGGALAARAGMPLLVTPPGPLHPAVATAIDALDVTDLLVLGGTAGVSQEAENAAMDAMGAEHEVRSSERIAGEGREGTAALLAMRPPEDWDPETAAVLPMRERYILVNGHAADGWAFGLPAAGLSADFDAPVLLGSVNALANETAALVDGCRAGHADVAAIGGTLHLDESADATGGCDDPRFLCGVWTRAELQPVVQPPWTFGMDLDQLATGEGGLADVDGLCLWIDAEFRLLMAVQTPGREAYDDMRETAEESGEVEDADGFGGEAFVSTTDESVAYTVYDGRWTWMVIALSFGDPIPDDVHEAVGDLTAILIERRGG
jgi:putative cell wall-binding protein